MPMHNPVKAIPQAMMSLVVLGFGKYTNAAMNKPIAVGEKMIKNPLMKLFSNRRMLFIMLYI